MKSENNKNKKDKKSLKPIDIIIMIILAALVISMAIFTTSRQTGNQEIILMEIYKSAGPDTSTASINHYYVYENTNYVRIRNSNVDGSNDIVTKEITQESINNLKDALDKYIGATPTINNSFYINERYTIKYNGKSIIVPNPSVATLLGFDASEYTFYNSVDSFINNINS